MVYDLSEAMDLEFMPFLLLDLYVVFGLHSPLRFVRPLCADEACDHVQRRHLCGLTSRTFIIYGARPLINNFAVSVMPLTNCMLEALLNPP